VYIIRGKSPGVVNFHFVRAGGGTYQGFGEIRVFILKGEGGGFILKFAHSVLLAEGLSRYLYTLGRGEGVPKRRAWAE
jgi:hypothetical protein